MGLDAVTLTHVIDDPSSVLCALLVALFANQRRYANEVTLNPFNQPYELVHCKFDRSCTRIFLGT